MSLNVSSTRGSAPTASPLLVVVAAALIDAAGRVLMQRRPLGKAHAGLWEFPGGKVEAGESPQAALARELHEELGIVVADADLVPSGFAVDRTTVLLLFACRHWGGEPSALEADAMCWDVPARLAHLPMPPLDIPLVQQLARGRDPTGDH